MDDLLRTSLAQLSALPRLQKKAVIGFDAVVDKIAKPIRHLTAQHAEFFGTIEDFSAHLQTKASLSCCVQLEIVTEKMGGNMVILSAALHELGVPLELVGALEGVAQTPMFAPIRDTPHHCVSKPGVCMALEFQNGKIMLAERGFVNFGWSDMVRAIGLRALDRLFSEPDLLCLVNWSEMPRANEIWQEIAGLLEQSQADPHRWILLDFSDCSAHADQPLGECLQIVRRLAASRRTVISMNKNEALRLVKHFGIPAEGHNDWGQELSVRLAPSLTVVHTNTMSAAYLPGNPPVLCPSFHTSDPKILTGGGDNFNAGLCLGLLHNLDLSLCLLLANANSGYYVRHGRGANLDELIAFITEEEQHEHTGGTES